MVPCGQLIVMVMRLPDCFLSVILHFSMSLREVNWSPAFSLQTCCVVLPMPAGRPAMFILVVISQSSSVPAAWAAVANANASANSVFTFSPLVERCAHYDLGCADA